MKWFRWASISYLYEQARTVLQRFPLPLLVALLGTVAALYLTDNSDAPEPKNIYFKLLLTALLGLPLTVASTLVGENRNLSVSVKWGLQLLSLLLLGAYFWHLPYLEKSPEVYAYEFMLLWVATHLLVSFAPFITQMSREGFWTYNLALFIRILTAVLYSAVLFAGLSVALLSIDNLLDIKVSVDSYRYLFIWIAGIFNTWFFLAGIPEDTESLKYSSTYPLGVKIFTQYVLIPLVVVYLVILYAYSIKIMLIGELPKGWVSYLILGFSILGIFALLLVYPLRNSQEHRWIAIFSRLYYWALLPLLVLLYVAIFTRLLDYGFTEKRYFVLLIALWLTGICLYFVFSTAKNIRLIPISLFVVVLLATFGPWSAANVSIRSQMNRFDHILNQHNCLKDGIFSGCTAALPDSSHQEMVSIIQYITTTHGYQHFQPYFKDDLNTLSDKYKYEAAEELRQMFQVQGEGMVTEAQDNFFTVRYPRAVQVSGYDQLIECSLSIGSEYVYNNKAKNLEVKSLLQADNTLQLSIYKNGALASKCDISLQEFTDTLHQRYKGGKAEIEPAELQMEGVCGSVRYQLQWSEFFIHKEKEDTLWKSTGGQAWLLWSDTAPPQE
ncbi:MAG: DUF4153 domain-containing protein [Sphingobacteriales bacterium]|nr:DUF4153 domain-containing protein [Sphingobacteriales bacterium]